MPWTHSTARNVASLFAAMFCCLILVACNRPTSPPQADEPNRSATPAAEPDKPPVPAGEADKLAAQPGAGTGTTRTTKAAAAAKFARAIGAEMPAPAKAQPAEPTVAIPDSPPVRGPLGDSLIGLACGGEGMGTVWDFRSACDSELAGNPTPCPCLRRRRPGR